MHFQVNLGHKRAGGVNDLQAARRRLGADGGRDAVGGEDQNAAFGDIRQIIREDGPPAAQSLHDMLIMDDLMAHIDGRPEDFQRLLDHINGPVHTGAEAARAGKKCFHGMIIPDTKAGQ